MKLSDFGEGLRILKKENKDWEVGPAGQRCSPKAHTTSLESASFCSLPRLPIIPTSLL